MTCLVPMMSLLFDSPPQPVNATDTRKRPANDTNIDFFTALLRLLMLQPPIFFQFIIMAQVILSLHRS